MEQAILNGVGKKLRNSFLLGKTDEKTVMAIYRKNKSEAESYSTFGLNDFELLTISKETHNPLLRLKVENLISERKEKRLRSKEQNHTNIEKLNKFKEDALGIGLRQVIHKMKRYIHSTGNKEAQIVLLLLETEFANLTAKEKKQYSSLIYERKDILLEKLASILKDTYWVYGVNYNTGKNASYLIYIYLPNGVQLTWHCNDYYTASCYPIRYELEWDGQICMTMEKILNFIESRAYCIDY